MQKFEYAIEPVIKSKSYAVANLNKFGNEGWELVAVDEYFAYFKRKKED